MNLKQLDRVQIIAPHSAMHGEIGTVVRTGTLLEIEFLVSGQALILRFFPKEVRIVGSMKKPTRSRTRKKGGKS